MMGGVRMAQITPEQTTKAIHPVLGIMGGLGPAASCYLYQMITDHTPAQKDQDHIDIVISSRASTPDRTAFIVGKSKDDPFDVMEQDGISLVRYGATVLAIACNTAHYFYDRLAAAMQMRNFLLRGPAGTGTEHAAPDRGGCQGGRVP